MEGNTENFAAESVNGDKPPPFVSVIIPHYNDSDRLALCLEAVQRQTYPRDRFEVIVVDNGSSDERWISLQARFPKVHFEREPRVGSYRARNKGIEVATGDILALTDSDCIPDPEWIEQGSLAFDRDPKIGMVGGRVTVFPKRPGRLTMVEKHQLVSAFNQQRYLKQLQFSVTANLFVSREAIQKAGRFDPRLRSGGDVEWGHRVHGKGFKQVYCAKARVRHPCIRSWKQILKKRIRITGGHYVMERWVSSNWARILWEIHLRTQLIPVIVYYWNHERFKSYGDRMSFILIGVVEKALGLGEAIRLLLGGQPTRC